MAVKPTEVSPSSSEKQVPGAGNQEGGEDTVPSSYLFLRLLGFQREVAQEIHKLGCLPPVSRQFWPDRPHQVQQQLLLGLVGVPKGKMSTLSGCSLNL